MDTINYSLILNKQYMPTLKLRFRYSTAIHLMYTKYGYPFSMSEAHKTPWTNLILINVALLQIYIYVLKPIFRKSFYIIYQSTNQSIFFLLNGYPCGYPKSNRYFLNFQFFCILKTFFFFCI